MSAVYIGSTKIESKIYISTDIDEAPGMIYNDPIYHIPSGVTKLGNNIFSSTRGGSAILWFAGDPPTLGTTPFNGTNITVYYKSSNTKWTSAIKTSWQNNGGASSITWKTY